MLHSVLYIKKLEQIAMLKGKRDGGEKLELNQVKNVK